MIYLDYSANTPADPAVLEAFCRTEQTYIGNPNYPPRRTGSAGGNDPRDGEHCGAAARQSGGDHLHLRRQRV